MTPTGTGPQAFSNFHFFGFYHTSYLIKIYVLWGKFPLGKTSVEKSRLLLGIAQISETPPTPQLGQLGPLFSGRQNDVLRV